MSTKGHFVFLWALPIAVLTACSTPNQSNVPVVSTYVAVQPAQPPAKPATVKAPPPKTFSSVTNAPAETDDVAPVTDRSQDPNLPDLLSRDTSAKRSGILNFRDTWKSRITSGYYDDAMGRVSDFAPYVYYDHQHINMLETMLR